MLPAAPAFGRNFGTGKGKGRAHSVELFISGPSRIKPKKSRGRGGGKAGPSHASGSNSGPGDQSVQSDVIELFDSDYEEVDVSAYCIVSRFMQGASKLTQPHSASLSSIGRA